MDGGRKSRRQSAALEGAMGKLSLDLATNTALPPSSPPNGFSPQDAQDRQRTPIRTSSTITSSRRTSTPLLNRKTSTSSLQGSSGAASPRPSSRRSSQATPDLNARGSRSPLPEFHEKPPPEPLTATAVAHSFFTEELKLHESGIQNDSSTTVILQDACFGHRYSRPKTSKANLSTVVERPERIHASILGVAAAYVRLGKRHAEGLHPPHPFYDHSSISSIPFKIKKSDRALPLNSPPAVAVHGAKWMDELKIMCDAAESKLALNGKELVRPPSTGGIEDKPHLHEGDLYLCGESLNAMQGSLGAVCEGVDTVFGNAKDAKLARKAFVCIRPPGHHCSASYPSGFCWLNNVHVGIAHGAIAHGLTHAAIVDFDLHHGDGSQAITWEHNAKVARMPRNAANAKKTSIGYFSLHDINSYPCEMGDFEKVRNASVCVENAHGQTIWNVHLQPWKNASEFWELYETKYRVLLDKTRDYLRFHTQRLKASGVTPKSVIFLSSGFDASEWEGAGMQRHKVNVPTDFYARFTNDIVKIAEEEGTSAEGRVISVLEGGYSDRALCTGVWSHLSGLTGFQETESEASTTMNGLATEIAGRIGAEISQNSTANVYSPAWWTLPKIETLEAAANPTPPPQPPKQVRTSGTPTYATSTQSFNAKIVSTGLGRRSASQSSLSLTSRPPTPPPPEVDWAAAAHGLRKALVPTDRETMSHKPETLAPETQRAKRDRQSVLGIPAADSLDGKRMTLRDRKGRDPVASIPEDGEKTLSRADRRKTVASGFGLGLEATSSGPAPPRVTHSRRRSSIASTMSSVTETSRDSVPPEIPAVPAVPKSKKIVPIKAEPSNPRLTVNKTRPVPKAPVRPRVARATTSPPTDAPATTPAVDSDLDLLANGMKTMSIKLNMPSREEHDAREKKRLEDAKLAKAPKKAPAKPRAPAKKGTQKSSPPQVPALPSTAPPAEQKQPEVKVETPVQTEMEFIPYNVPSQQDVTPPQSDEIKQEPLVWLPPNTSTPPQAVLKKTLPAFSSTSAIPFAPRPDSKQEKRVLSSESEASTRDGPSSDTTETLGSVTESEKEVKGVFDVPVSP